MNFAPGHHPREPAPQLSVNLKVIGLGGAGSAVVDRLAAIGLGASGFLALDTDSQALQRVVMASKVAIGAKRTRGLGCGGDPGLGRQCLESANRTVAKQLEGVEVTLLVVGLGGGLGTGAAPAFAKMAREQGALVIALAMMPFDCEGRRRCEQARAGLEELREAADAVIRLPNQLVLELNGNDKTARETFEAANALVLQGVFGIGRLLRADGLLTAGLADLRAVLNGRGEESALAAAEAEGRGRHRALLNQLSSHPFMEKGRVLKDADALLVSLVGGTEMTMADVNEVTKRIDEHCPGAEVVLSAAIDPTFQGKLGVTVITARGRPEPEPVVVEELLPKPEEPRAGKKPRGRKRKVKQQELGLQSVSKGRFEKSEPTLHHGEDLDVPTFMRRNLVLN